MKLPSSVARPGRRCARRRSSSAWTTRASWPSSWAPGGEIAGYAVADDLSARDLQKREPQWTRAKGFDGSCPFGPWITTADEVAEPGDLALRTWVNGELRQDSRTSDLIFGVAEIVAFLARDDARWSPAT